MHRVILAAVVLGLARPAAGGEAEQAWAALFAQASPAGATAQMRAVLAACDNSPAKLKALIAADTAYPALKPGWYRQVFPATDGRDRVEVEVFTRVPKGYAPRKSHPLLLAAHGQNGTGREIGASMEVLLGKEVERYVLVAPTMPHGERGFVADPLQVEAHLTSLKWARTNLNIDDDRIYVTGYGQGGYVAWHLAVLYPHLFAAAVPMAGLPFFQGAPYTLTCYLENLDHLPVWAVWGEKDRPSPSVLGNAGACRIAAARLKELGNALFKPTELPGAGHFACWPRGKDLRAYLASQKRRRTPAAIRHFFHLPQHGRGYYVEALKLAGTPLDFTRPILVQDESPDGRKPTPGELLEAGSRHMAKRLYKVWAEVDRSTNALRVRPRGVTEVRVYVLEGLLDLSRTAELSFGSAHWKGKVPVSARCMLQHYAATRDATAPVCNEADLHITGKALIRYE